ncbi:hypothetical protein [Kineococcus glutinatus]|uniref:Uncharacterized protein n=1 Tax=Kineococcus glutinatus TaxID=1070872 RepID=A0ABP9I5W0_9ACTN
MTHHDKPEEHDEHTGAQPDPDADPGTLNPRDTRGEHTGDAVAEDGGSGADPDADPENLNPRG